MMSSPPDKPESELPANLTSLIQGSRVRTTTEFDISIRLKGPNAEKFYQEAVRRGVHPVDLMADLLDAIIGDNLYEAVLDT